MNTLYNEGDAHDIRIRIDRLTPQAQRLWGKMDVGQMMAHCSAALEVAVGDKRPPRLFIGRILGPLVKPSYVGPKPFGKNSPTDRSFIMTGQKEFNKEKERLLQLIDRFSEGGLEKCTTHPHSFFGKLTPEEWGISMQKHLDHHLRQFGV